MSESKWMQYADIIGAWLKGGVRGWRIANRKRVLQQMLQAHGVDPVEVSLPHLERFVYGDNIAYKGEKNT